jgi:hypothetical protein
MKIAVWMNTKDLPKASRGEYVPFYHTKPSYPITSVFAQVQLTYDEYVCLNDKKPADVSYANEANYGDVYGDTDY